MISSYRPVLAMLLLVVAIDVRAQDSNPGISLNPSVDGWYSLDFTDPSLLAGLSDHATISGKNFFYPLPQSSSSGISFNVRRCMAEPFALGDVQGTRCHGVQNLQGSNSI